jgi:thiamine biosynthesis lipoprotein
MHAMGFRGDAGGGDPQGTIDASAPVNAVAALTLDPATRSVRTRDAGVRLDLGAIAKGWALDRAADVLRESGVASAFLHAGTSSALALGPRSWRVDIAGIGTIELRGAALSVSALHGQYVERSGERVGHEMDPRSGRPASGTARAACVVDGQRADPAAMADAWSTALIVGGEGALLALPPGVHGCIETDAGPRATLGWRGRTHEGEPRPSSHGVQGGWSVGTEDRTA